MLESDKNLYRTLHLRLSVLADLSTDPSQRVCVDHAEDNADSELSAGVPVMQQSVDAEITRVRLSSHPSLNQPGYQSRNKLGGNIPAAIPILVPIKLSALPTKLRQQNERIRYGNSTLSLLKGLLNHPSYRNLVGTSSQLGPMSSSPSGLVKPDQQAEGPQEHVFHRIIQEQPSSRWGSYT